MGSFIRWSPSFDIETFDKPRVLKEMEHDLSDMLSWERPAHVKTFGFSLDPAGRTAEAYGRITCCMSCLSS